MGEVKLIGAFPSPYSYRVEWALMLKGVEYEYTEEDLRNKSPLLLKSNPVHKKIPVLLHDGKPIAESLVILEYIEETWKENPLLPEDPHERAKARFWVKVAEECSMNIRNAVYSKGEEQEKAVELALEALKALDEEIKEKKFFGGESIGFVDLVLGWISHWLPVIEEVCGLKIFNAQAFPSLNQWGHNFLNSPIIKEKLPPSDRMLAFFTDVQKNMLK